MWLAAALGVAHAYGFWLCIMRALQIGPAGPTVTINNMAMVAGVLYGLLALAPTRPTAWTVAGLAGICTALLLLGFGRPAENAVHRAAARRWGRLVAVGGAFSCLSFVAQTHVGALHPAYKYLFGAAGFDLAALLLLPPMLRRPASFRRRGERLGGLALGVTNAMILPLTLMAIRQVGAEVALPITLASPILPMLVIGRVFYKERLSAAAWIACVLGALSVAAVAYGTER